MKTDRYVMPPQMSPDHTDPAAQAAALSSKVPQTGRQSENGTDCNK